MKSSRKEWGALKVSSVGDAIAELRLGLNIPVKALTDSLGIARTTLYRYEAGEPLPIPTALFFLRLAVEKNAPGVIVRSLSTELAERLNVSDFAALLLILITPEGSDAPRRITRLAKRAAKILEAE